MTILSNAERFQSQLHQYVQISTPDYWPVWLMLAGMALALMLAVLVLHGALRYRLAARHPSGREEKVYLYSRAIRLWHWSNALLFVLLLASGFVNHFALASVANTARLVTLHAYCGYLLMAGWAAFLLINAFGGNGHHYIPQTDGWRRRIQRQIRFYLFGIIKGEAHPFPATPRAKFNPLQQIAYLGVMYALLPLLMISGLLAGHPDWLPAAWVSAKYWLLQMHFILATASLFFIFGHVYLCTTGRTPLTTFRCMLDGFHRH